MDHDGIMLYRTDPARNMARFYALALQPSLFGDVALVRRWGRLGTHGRCIIELHADRAGAMRALEHHRRIKLRRGYRV
ncbi:WGR domain-containing protein [Mesorhizobium sp. CAU 1741]|uniref:WGR domain-containing protein n=1 Tax=Mesorhizobium sp. CAU 1741 TaxID=3140366 RepID=UPI00325B3809